MIFPEFIQQFDEWAFLLINNKWANNLFDIIMPPVRDKNFWIPLYIIIAIVLVYQYRWKGLTLILLLGLNFGVSDQLSSAVIKPAVGRIRPCNDESFKEQVTLRIERCGAGKSFTSSHATNTFAFAVMLILLFRKKSRWIAPVALFWASLVSYAQIYVGVHYPIDILGGALLGTVISIIIYKIASRYVLPKLGPEL